MKTTLLLVCTAAFVLCVAPAFAGPNRGRASASFAAPAHVSSSAVHGSAIGTAPRFNNFSTTRLGNVNTARFNTINSGRFNNFNTARFNTVNTARFNTVNTARFNNINRGRLATLNGNRNWNQHAFNGVNGANWNRSHFNSASAANFAHHHHHHHDRNFIFFDAGFPFFGWDYGYPYPYSYYGDYVTDYPYTDGSYPYDQSYSYGAQSYDDSDSYNQQSNDGRSTVAEVQRQLAREGYYQGAIDGVMGSRTRYAIRAFKRAHGLSADGNIDNDLLQALRAG